MIALILHLLGDYVTQSDWMAQNKTKATWPALCHATVYSAPFALIASQEALFVIWFTHLLIDRFRLARYIAYAKNFLGPRSSWHAWEDCKGTGYHKETPPWMSVWLMIAADNTLHLLINHLCLTLL